MFRPTSRLIARSSAARTLPRAAAPAKRFLSTAPPAQKSRSWKSLAARIGAAGAIIYCYTTTDVFAEEPRHVVQSLPETEEETEQLPTIDALAEQRQRRKAEAAAAAEVAATQGTPDPNAVGAEQLEEEADQQGAFNPETGEINWDCPCLGGMAHGPCGEEFKAAFSCFVYSTDEPKGMDCIDKFKDMQNCFRQYPEVYGSELETNEEEDMPADGDQPGLATESHPDSPPPSDSPAPSSAEKVADTRSADPKGATERAKATTEQVGEEHAPVDERDSIIPREAFDQTDANEEKK